MTRITVHKMTTDQNENGDPIEWSLIELNGELLPPKQTSKIDKEDNAKPPKVELGSLYFDSKVRFIFLSTCVVENLPYQTLHTHK